MIPIGDLNPTTRLPIVNRVLLFVNLIAWFYVLSLGRTPGAAEAFYDRYAFDWDRFTAAIAGGRIGIETLLPLFTHMFLHGGWLHIIGNMLYLWVFGDNVEDRLGSGRYLIFYLLAGVAAAVGQGLVSPSPMVGASGAIAGVLGAYLLLFPTARVRTLIFLGVFITVIQLPALVVIGFFIVIQLFEGIAELRIAALPAAAHIAYYAHIFGFVAGILLLLLFRRGQSSRRTRYG